MAYRRARGEQERVDRGGHRRCGVLLCLVAAVLSSMHKMTVREAREAGRETVVPDDDVSSLLTPRGAGAAAGREFPSGARVTRDAACA